MSAKRFLAMAMMMAAISSGGMGMCGTSRSSYEPNIPDRKRIIPGKFKGTVPKGCKLHTEAIETKWQGHLLTKNVDIIYGSEKAKQKSIVKAGFEIKEYLMNRKSYGRSEVLSFPEFDQVEELPKEETPFSKILNNETK